MSNDANDKKPFEFSGKLHEKFDTVQRGSFSSREFVIEKSTPIKDRTITDYIKCQLVQDKTALIDKFNVGDEINVYFNLKGNKWQKEGRTSYFTNIDVWRIEPLSKAGGEESYNDQFLEPLDNFTSSDSQENDLPF